MKRIHKDGKTYPVEKFLKRLAKVFKAKPEVINATFEIIKQELNAYFKENRPVKLDDVAYFDLGFVWISFKKICCSYDPFHAGEECIVGSANTPMPPIRSNDECTMSNATPTLSLIRSINEGLVDFTVDPAKK
jgi:hypothetical protein